MVIDFLTILQDQSSDRIHLSIREVEWFDKKLNRCLIRLTLKLKHGNKCYA